MLVHAAGWLLLFAVVAVLIITVTRDKVERYADGRPVDPGQQAREGYSCIVLAHPGVQTTSESIEDILTADDD